MVRVTLLVSLMFFSAAQAFTQTPKKVTEVTGKPRPKKAKP